MSNAGLERDTELLDVEAVLAAATSVPAGRKKRCEKEGRRSLCNGIALSFRNW